MATRAAAQRRAWTRVCLQLGTAVLVTACGGDTQSPPQPDVAVTSDDLAIAALAYAPDQRVPAGFHAEPARYADRSEFVFHVRTSDLGNPVVSADYEVCSDDFAEALQWSADSAVARAYATTLSGNLETAWFYQFERPLANDPSGIVINRVFKCATLDRSSADNAGNAGQLTKRPFAADDLKFVSEYLWHFSVYNNALHAVLSSVPGTDGTGLTHTLQRVQVETGAGADGCDRIAIWDWVHSADAGGRLRSEQRFVRAFDARFEFGSVALCD